MATYSELLKDPRWQKKRLEIFERDLFTCQHCMSTTKTLCIHHIRYFGMPWECPNKFLITLCEDCHDIEESRKNMDFYSVFSESGLTRKDLLLLIEHVNYYTQEIDHRDVGIMNSILQKIVPDADLKNFLKFRQRTNG